MTTVREHLELALAGSYTIERELGGGGMSHVFVADDTTLRRKVVVKVLHADLAEGLSAERFKREIQVVARLQHPHIVPLLSAGVMERDGGSLYYTMPFIDGESLRGRIEREGALPIADVIQLVCDVVSALAYAHRQRIVHRDIKPENILLADGGAVVSDFGIAKAISAARAEERPSDARRSTTLTQRGTSIGTPAYMAPEQATGEAVDHRADLYSVGVVMYEMLTGRPPFEGRSPQRLIAAHAIETPEPVERRRSNVTPALARIVRQLLEKHPADRPHSADDVLRDLNAAAVATPEALPVGSTLGVVGAEEPPMSRWRQRFRDPVVRALAFLSLASLVTAVALTVALGAHRGPVAIPRTRVILDLPADARFNPSGLGSSLTFSPDGSALVYVGGGQSPHLWMRRLDELAPRALAGTDGAQNPQFSLDGRWIGFVINFVLKAVPAAGGPVITIANGVGRFTWGDEGVIVFSKPSALSVRSGLFMVRFGGVPEPLTQPDTLLGGYHGGPTFLPDGKTVLFVIRSGLGNSIAAVRLGTREIVPLGIAGGTPVYVPGGYLAFARGDGTVAAVRFDAQRLRVSGEPVTVLDSVMMKSGGASDFVVASNGTLAYVPGILSRELTLVDRHGATRTITPPIRNLSGSPRVSPDGRRIAAVIGQPPFSGDVWIYDLSSATGSPLTSGGSAISPEWMPDGRGVAWASTAAPGAVSSRRMQAGIWWRRWDGSAPAELLVAGAQGPKFTPRGDSLVVTTTAGNVTELRLVRPGDDPVRSGRTLLPATAGPRQARISRDGHWLAYVSDESGMREVYVQPFPGPGGHFAISSGGGTEPAWGPSATELFYRSGAALMAATIRPGPELTVVRRDTLFMTELPFGSTEGTYDLMPDGNHFVMTRVAAAGIRPVLVIGWADEVRERIEAAQKR